MGHEKILSLLNEASDSKFVTTKWNIVNDQSDVNYGVGNEILYSTKVLKSNLCDYNNAQILVRGNITITGHQVPQVAFKNCATFIKCMKKFDGTTIDDPEDLDLAMPVYNLIDYSSNYFEATGSLLFYSKYEAINFDANITNNNNFKSFKYKAKLLGNTKAQPNSNQTNRIFKNATIAVPLKY